MVSILLWAVSQPSQDAPVVSGRCGNASFTRNGYVPQPDPLIHAQHYRVGEQSEALLRHQIRSRFQHPTTMFRHGP